MIDEIKLGNKYINLKTRIRYIALYRCKVYNPNSKLWSNGIVYKKIDDINLYVTTEYEFKCDHKEDKENNNQ